MGEERLDRIEEPKKEAAAVCCCVLWGLVRKKREEGKQDDVAFHIAWQIRRRRGYRYRRGVPRNKSVIEGKEKEVDVSER